MSRYTSSNYPQDRQSSADRAASYDPRARSLPSDYTPNTNDPHHTSSNAHTHPNPTPHDPNCTCQHPDCCSHNEPQQDTNACASGRHKMNPKYTRRHSYPDTAQNDAYTLNLMTDHTRDHTPNASTSDRVSADRCRYPCQWSHTNAYVTDTPNKIPKNMTRHSDPKDNDSDGEQGSSRASVYTCDHTHQVSRPTSDPQKRDHRDERNPYTHCHHDPHDSSSNHYDHTKKSNGNDHPVSPPHDHTPSFSDIHVRCVSIGRNPSRCNCHPLSNSLVNCDPQRSRHHEHHTPTSMQSCQKSCQRPRSYSLQPHHY